MSKIEEAMKLIGPGCACEVNLGNILVLTGALKEAIEQHEAFRQEVSDAVVNHLREYLVVEDGRYELSRFIITKPDPLEEIIKRNYAGSMSPPQIAYAIRKELDERGLEIREKSK